MEIKTININGMEIIFERQKSDVPDYKFSTLIRKDRNFIIANVFADDTVLVQIERHIDPVSMEEDVDLFLTMTATLLSTISANRTTLEQQIQDEAQMKKLSRAQYAEKY